MPNELRRAVAEKIFEHFDGEYPVYTEKINQNLVMPCFFAKIGNIEKINLLGGRYFLRCEVEVSFLTEGESENHLEESVAGEIFGVLNFVQVGDVKLFGRKMTWTKEDGSFSVRAYYDIFGKEETEETAMMEKIVLEEEVDGVYERGVEKEREIQK